MSTDNTDAIGMSGRSARGEPSTLLLSLREAFDRTLQLLADGGSSSSDGVGTMFRNSLTTERQLQLYGLYKFITVGPVISSGDHNCTTDPPPNVWNVKAYQKHRAWESLSQTKSAKVMSQDEAMREYIELVVVSAASSSNKDGSLALQNLADQCQGMLDQVDNNNNTSLVSTASDEEETNNVGTRESGAICSSLHCNSTTEKLRKDSLSPKSCEDDAFKPENTVRGLGLASRLQTFVTDILGIQPMIPRGQLDISNADLRFAAWHCFTAFGHVQQQRLYRHYESKIVQQWKTAIISASGVPQKPTTALRKTKDCLVKDEAGPNVIVGLSVRSLFDLYLRVMQYPAGSEVIVSPPFNVPGMLQVLAHHRLQTVAIDLPENHRNDDDVIVAVDCDAIANAVTPRTVAILVVHAFGMITGNDDEMQALRMLATTQNKNGRTINIIEDCAECFAGLGEGAYLGSPHADVSFFSFGMIKTMTALNGGVAIFRNQVVDKSSKAKGLKTEQFESMIRLHSSSCYEVQQTNGAFLWKVCKSFVMRAIADSPFLYGLIYIVVSRILGLDFDGVVTSLLRGFRLDKDGAIQHRNTDGETPMPQNGLISQIRKRPSSAMLALLHRRLYQSTPVAESVSKRVKSCRQLSKHLLEERGNNSYPIRIPTSHRGSENFFWLYPVLANDPDRASEHMRSHGFDATTGASQLCCVAPPGVASCPRAKRFMNEALYLPMDCGSGWSIEQMHVRLVRAIHAIPKPNGDNHPHPHLSAPIAAPTKGGMEKKCVTLLFVTLASGLLPACLFRFFFAVVVHGLELACCLTTLVTLMLWLLRLSSGNLYLELSRGFAKYSALLQNGNERQDKGGLANATGSVEAGSSANVLSSIRALDLPLMYGGDELRSVLLTGGIGFIGSMVLRDLLFYRETLCVDRVVVLCRPKRGKSANERVAAVLDEDLYSFLTENEKNLLVDVVEGDTTQAHAGLSDRVVNRLCHNYNITHVFHCAASVSFTQNLRDAATANILSTLNVQSMSSRLNKSRVQFVHISSAFVHGLSGDNNQPLPEELFSLGKFDPIEIYKSMCGTQFYASKAMCELGFPNTYTFSKSVCEHLLVLNDPNTLIIRPSIVGPAVETPHEGWAGRTPSTLVAAAGLYLSYQWNVWSFGGQRVPCVPVDVVSRFVVAKAFWKSSSELPKRLPASIETSSEESFEKLSRTSTPSSEAGLSGTDSDSSSAHQIFNAAWDIRSPSVACFTWRDYAGAVTQIGSVMGYFSRPTAYIGLLVSSRLSPKASMSAIQFERLHTWCVQYPFQLVLRIRNVLGFETKQMRQLESILDLPLLFYPFMNNGFHFNSELIAPLALNGERYVISCVAAAHFFVSRALARHNRLNRLQHPLYDEPRQVMSFLPVGGFMHHDKSPSLWWALTQPQGNFLIRVTGWMLAVVLRACYSEVTVDVISFAATLRAKDATSSTCLILAPTHRSFFDFLLLSYVSFCIPELQIRIPCIVAADEFARLPVIGWLLQFLGAFFVRRGRMAIDPCLAATISSIKSVSSFSDRAIEVFIEGTRSRDRRFVKPKTGVLRCLREAGGNYVVVPITISYDRIAEQESLVKEASGGTGTSLNVGAMLSWLLISTAYLQKAFKGQIRLGRVHVSACEPLEMGDDCTVELSCLAEKIQQKQATRIIVSDYHVEAASQLLKLEKQVVKRAFDSLGVTIFPETETTGSSTMAPLNTSEMLSLLLQASASLAPLFTSVRPEWSKWLNRPTSFQLGSVVDDPEVALLKESLLRLFDEADQCVDEAVAQLEMKRFLRPRQHHILHASIQLTTRVPPLLLHASIMIRFPTEKVVNLSASGVMIPKTTRIRVGSEEALGYWGFYDSLFVIRADKFTGPYVRLEGNRYSLRDKKITGLLAFIEEQTKVKINPLREAFSEQVSSLACTLCQLSDKDIELLKAAVSTVSTSDEDRIRHGTGHSQEDVFLVRSGVAFRVPDIVAWPASEIEVLSIIAMAKEYHWCVVPFGGGTNVSQSTRCPSIEVEPRPIVSLDMRSMSRILWVDEENGLAHVEAGITGRKLEEEMARHGYTMGHEPDSIEFSTLGGWIATKASGMKRNKYGNIEDIVKAVIVAGPDGILRHGQDDGKHVWGRESCGMDLRSLVLGSEGCLGVIISAVIRIWPVPETKDYDSILLPNFEEGLCFVRKVSKLGANIPVSVRLLDNEHFRLGLALQPDTSSVASLLKTCFGAFVKWKVGFEPSSIVCATIAYEGTRREVADQKRIVSRLGNLYGGVKLTSASGKSSYEMTFMIAYIRDFAMTYYFLGESFETFAPWSKIESIVAKTKAKIHEEHTSRCLPGEPFIGCRVTQLYHEGVCLYFYFCMSFEGVMDASSVYSKIEHAARSEVLANGGSISHHHGIGKIRASFIKEVDSVPLRYAMKSIKKGIDRDNVFGVRNGLYGD